MSGARDRLPLPVIASKFVPTPASAVVLYMLGGAVALMCVCGVRRGVRPYTGRNQLLFWFNCELDPVGTGMRVRAAVVKAECWCGARPAGEEACDDGKQATYLLVALDTGAALTVNITEEIKGFGLRHPLP